MDQIRGLYVMRYGMCFDLTARAIDTRRYKATRFEHATRTIAVGIVMRKGSKIVMHA